MRSLIVSPSGRKLPFRSSRIRAAACAGECFGLGASRPCWAWRSSQRAIASCTTSAVLRPALAAIAASWASSSGGRRISMTKRIAIQRRESRKSGIGSRDRHAALRGESFRRAPPPCPSPREAGRGASLNRTRSGNTCGRFRRRRRARRSSRAPSPWRAGDSNLPCARRCRFLRRKSGFRGTARP